MSIGDNICTCPQCKMDNRHVNVERVEGVGDYQLFFVRCNSCGLVGEYDLNRNGAIEKWNKQT